MILKKVVVLLSTYNGEKFLHDMLNSILCQTYPSVSILIRDDGSIDTTCKIIQEYCDKYDNIKLVKGINVGPARSFMDLLKQAPNADYYAFADQDDVWMTNKIENGIALLEQNNACLYHSNYQMTDACLRPISTSQKPFVNSIGQAAILYPCTGCTMIFTKKLRDIVNSYTPNYLVMHDAWIYKIAMAVCKDVIFDNNSYIYYRQHGNNVIGGLESNASKRFWHRFKRLIYPERSRSREMKELATGFSNIMDEETSKLVTSLAYYLNYSFMQRLKIAFDKRFITSVKSKNFLFKLSLLIKNY